MTYWEHLSIGADVASIAATRDPADAPANALTLCKNRGAWSTRHLATPRWYTPKNPQPANDRFMGVGWGDGYQ